MVVHTTDPQSTLARKQQLEFTLLNHPIDCPICDKAGECTLQKLYFEHDNADSRVDVPKVHKAKVVDLGPTIVLDQERCILCSRCIRTCDEVAGQHQLEFAHRGDHEVLTTAPGEQLDNPYSLNTVDVCPVGALTAKDFRFTMRAWELEATPSVCNGCATGCNIEIHHKNGRAWRLVPRHNPDVNKYWMCDEGRFTYHDAARAAARRRDGRRPARRLGPRDPRRGRAPRRAPGQRRGAGRRRAVGRAHPTRTTSRSRKLAKAWGVAHVFIAAQAAGAGARRRPAARRRRQPEHARGVKAIAEALGLAAHAGRSSSTPDVALRALVMLGDVLPGRRRRRSSRELERHRDRRARARPGRRSAKVALPAADWAEVAGTVTNAQGRVQRMHAAFAPPGQALPAWEAVVRLAQRRPACKLAWTHAREVFKDMTATVPAVEAS